MKHCLVLNFPFCISIIWWSFYKTQRKSVNFKLVVLINCRKIYHQQKNSFIMCKQLNGAVFKSLKRSRPKFWFFFRVGWGPGRNFYLYLGPTRAEIAIFPSWAGPEKSGLTSKLYAIMHLQTKQCSVLDENTILSPHYVWRKFWKFDI